MRVLALVLLIAAGKACPGGSMLSCMEMCHEFHWERTTEAKAAHSSCAGKCVVDCVTVPKRRALQDNDSPVISQCLATQVMELQETCDCASYQERLSAHQERLSALEAGLTALQTAVENGGGSNGGGENGGGENGGGENGGGENGGGESTPAPAVQCNGGPNTEFDGGNCTLYNCENYADGSWRRIIRTTGNADDFGQANLSSDDAPTRQTDPNAETGVFPAYFDVVNFDKIMLRKNDEEFSIFEMVAPSGGRSMNTLLKTCVANSHVGMNNDDGQAGNTIDNWTSGYSAQKVCGTIPSDLGCANSVDGAGSDPTYVIFCGVNHSSDNDASMLAFTSQTGASNCWGDSWRGSHQHGTAWSFWNNDYHSSPDLIAMNGSYQGLAGFKGPTPPTGNEGTYELWVYDLDASAAPGPPPATPSTGCAADNANYYFGDNCSLPSCQANEGDWVRIIRTTGDNEQFGQASLVQDGQPMRSEASADSGVYDAYFDVTNFDQIMVRKNNEEFAIFNMVARSNGRSMDQLLKECANTNDHGHGNDDGRSENSIDRWTAGYGAEFACGNMSGDFGCSGTGQNPQYVSFCGVNRSSDNDASILAFTVETGIENCWSDSWRGTGQQGTMWSFWNNDYHTTSDQVAMNGLSQAGAGYRRPENAGTYELWVRPTQ